MLHRITKPGRTAAIAAALAVAVAGAGSATAASLVTGASVKNASLTGADVRNGTLKRADLGKGVRAALDAKAAPGPEGPAGPAGANGAVAVRAVTDSLETISILDDKVLEITLPAGAHLIEAKAQLDNANDPTQAQCELHAGPNVLDWSIATLADGRGNTVYLSAPVTFETERTVVLTCEGDNIANDPIVARKSVMTATEVQQILTK